MTLIALSTPPTSAAGAMLKAGVIAGSIALALLEPGTGSSYPRQSVRAGTSANYPSIRPSQQVEAPQSVPEALFELRQRSGFTWEEIAQVFGVSRRSIHNWASGDGISSAHDRKLRELLCAVRSVDLGNPRQTRDALLSSTDGKLSIFDMMKKGSFGEVFLSPGRSASVSPLPTRAVATSTLAARRPPPPADLVEGRQDRIHSLDGKLAGRTIRLNKKA